MLKLIIDVARCILLGMGVGFMAFLKVFPIYNELGNIKEEVIACAIGVPVIVVSLAFMIPSLIKLFKKVSD